MRHRIRNRKLGCRTPHRKAMMRNMVTSLLEHGRIVTTVTRAKELRRLADKMVTLGKDGSLHARRQALSVIRSSQVVDKLFDDWSSRFADKNGGYTRIVKLGPRRGDASMMAVIELAVESFKQGRNQPVKSRDTGVAKETVIPSAAPVVSPLPEEELSEEELIDTEAQSPADSAEVGADSDKVPESAVTSSDHESEDTLSVSQQDEQKGSADVEQDDLTSGETVDSEEKPVEEKKEDQSG